MEVRLTHPEAASIHEHVSEIIDSALTLPVNAPEVHRLSRHHSTEESRRRRGNARRTFRHFNGKAADELKCFLRSCSVGLPSLFGSTAKGSGLSGQS